MSFVYITPPYDWQKNLLKLSMAQTDIAVLADMGTGKTKGIIDVLRYRYGLAKRIRKTLIISPLVTLYNWKDEFAKQSTIKPDRIHVMEGSTKKKLDTLTKAIKNDPCQILIVNYEALISNDMVKALLEWCPEILVLDESHYVKSHKAKRSKNVELIARQATQGRIISSGTAITNSVTDIFMQFKILDAGETFGTNFYTFQAKYMYDANARWTHLQKHFPKWEPRPEKFAELQEKIYKKGIRVNKEECVDLPDFVQEVYKVALSPSQRKAYDAMEKEFVAFVEESTAKGISVATTALTKALRLQQIVTGHVKTDDGNIIEFKDNPRLDALEELISSLHSNHKIIIWCAFKQNYIQIGKMLEKLKVKHVYITGNENLEQKVESMDSLRDDPEVRVAVCHRKAAGIGVNLVAADYSIVYSRNFSLEQELQSRDRNYRGGSNMHSKVTKIDLCAIDTVDELVTEALCNKKEIADSVIEIAKTRRTRGV